MPALSIEQLLDRLEELKRPAAAGGRGHERLAVALKQTARRRFTDAPSLIRFHEILLYLRAYPQNASLVEAAEKLLHSFASRVERLSADGADMSAFEEPNVSGIAATGFSAVFGYDITRWLARAHASRVQVLWDDYEDHAHLNLVWPKLLPLFEEDAYSDAHAPFLAWVRAAKRRRESDLSWLMRQFERLPVGEKQKAELFEPLRLWVRWELGNSKATRTLMRRRVRRIFYHDAPLIARRDVSLARELDAPPLAVERLSRAAGERLLAMGRDTMAVRFRELHGFTFGDPRSVVRADAGRGLEIFLWGIVPARRLPLLGYHAGIFFKNGVPMGYHEGLSLFERVEIGLNLFYTFRDGESAWAYARLMLLYRQLLGADVFSIDPYQLGGSGNEEGIESGAFWFYRKLGFRPVRAELATLVAAEERKIAARKNYRTPPRVLRRLASGHVIYEARADAAVAEAATTRTGEWDRFAVRNIGLAVVRRMASEVDGDAGRIRAASVATVKRALGAVGAKLNEAEERAFSNFALVLALIPDLARWTAVEKRDALSIIRAKASGTDESRYLRLLCRHARLRREIIALGTNASSQVKG
ncbi:MAG: hypothetical protein QOG00_3590 [Pyrinomonadaceae bacterium]|nr:hypothetical protein [Pyrinomonadaceae bacterium]